VGRVAGAKSIVLRKAFSFMPRGALCHNNTDADAGVEAYAQDIFHV